MHLKFANFSTREQTDLYRTMEKIRTYFGFMMFLLALSIICELTDPETNYRIEEIKTYKLRPQLLAKDINNE